MDISLVIKALEECYAFVGNSTCNIRKVASMLFLTDGTIYKAANSSQQHPCTLKGSDYCIREDGVGDLEYLTCPSPCAEGANIAAALHDKRETKGSIIVSTDFPCRRCKDIIIDYGVKELYFAEYHDHVPRLKDIFFADQMVANGMIVNRIIKEKGTDGTVIHSIQPHDLDGRQMAALAMRTSGTYYMRLILDDEFRQQELQKLRQLNEHYPMSADPGSLRLTPLL